MLEIFFLVVIGFAIGTYGTLVGIGGGPLIIPILALWYKFPTSTVIATSLFVIFFNTLSGSIAYFREKRIDMVSGTKFALITIPFSLLSTFGVYYINLSVFDVYFGLFLLILAGYILFKPIEADMAQPLSASGKNRSPFLKSGAPRSYSLLYTTIMRKGDQEPEKRTPWYKGGVKERIIKDKAGIVYRYQVNEVFGLVLTAIIGIFSTFLGIGGGLIQVPVLVYLLFFPVHIATATSHYITAINTLFTLIPFLVHGDVAYRPAVTLALGVVVGAQFGARFSMKLSGDTLLKLLIPVFIFMGLKLLFS
ncbi:MAG: sulfite exporter TauE/SafE family protein [Pseudomonadota bacterium]